MWIPKGVGRHPSRTLDFFELLFVREGMLAMQEGGRSFFIRAGQSLLLRPGRPHGPIGSYGEDLVFYWAYFSVPESQTGPFATLSLPQYATLANPDHMVSLFHRLFDEREEGALDGLVVNLTFMRLLCEIVAAPTGSSTGTPTTLLARRADSIIRNEFAREISTSSLAERLGCSAAYLGRVYRSVYGLSIVEAIHRQRVRHARQLLMSGESNVEEIARACGFIDGGYFRRIFKRHEGMTPLRYLRLHLRYESNE